MLRIASAARSVRRLGFRRHPSAVAVGARAASSTASSQTPPPPPATPPPTQLYVNDIAVSVPAGAPLIHACEKAGVEIPRFCFHERLSIAGNCRMCLVEVERSPKPVASCAMPAMPGMKVYTDTPLVRKAREGVMEFLLANHPLDCPICDQGGECDLQDQSVRYGSDRSRFNEHSAITGGKRAVENKDLGPLVKTVMTRCIHCTRCVRFANEVAGAVELGTSGRGNDMQIGTYVAKTLATEMSGNVVDLCPVGALTSKPYAFTARPWELKHCESIDVLDAVGSNIRVDSRGIEVMRILPRTNDNINEEWIADKTRFAYDGLKRQRLTTPLAKVVDASGNASFVPITWPEALGRVAAAMQTTRPEDMVGVAGALADVESLVALKDLLNAAGSENLVHDSFLPLVLAKHGAAAVAGLADLRPNYSFNATINGVDTADALLLVGTHPRHEAPILNTRIRKAFLHNNLDIAYVGELPAQGFNYDVDHLGTGPDALAANLERNKVFVEKLAKAKRPLIIVGSAVFQRPDAKNILAAVANIAKQTNVNRSEEGWNGLSILQRDASAVGAMDIGFHPTNHSTFSNTPKLMYLLNADNISSTDIPADAFVVYQGHHGDVGAHFADVVLPGAAYTEKAATYVNTEGRTQVTRAAVPPPASARADWTILRALSETAGLTLPYDDIHTLRERLYEISPTLVQYDMLDTPSATITTLALATTASAGATRPNASGVTAPFKLPISDYYMTDPISRASSTMAKCSAAFTRGEYKVGGEAVFA